MYWDSNSYITLQSASQVACDGETPTNVIVTFDANLSNSNVKLFINGKLEDMTGEAIFSDATGDNLGWKMGQNFNSSSSSFLQVANSSVFGNTTGEFKGRFEELSFYNAVLYPVTVQDGKYTFTKPLSENNSASTTTNIPYNARLFVKDYHNIRGQSVTEVASTSNISFKKAGFRLDNS
jgi:hypothetical protein